MAKKSKRGLEGFVFGEAELKTNAECLQKLMAILLELDLNGKNITQTSVCLAYPEAKQAAAVCAERGIEVELTLFRGLPIIISALLHRPGLIAGALIAIMVFAISGRVLWDVRVEGNVLLSQSEVREILAAHGVKPGASLSAIDIGTVQADIERECGEIAWISVNIAGTVAYVELIEASTPPVKAEPEGDGSNLVAEREGVICGFEVIAGEPAAEIGQTVKKGDLLVSGIIDSERFGFRAVESRGRVFARTEYVFEAEIPYEFTVREVKNSKICEISMIFFSFRQKIFKKGGFSGSEYDKIYSDIYVYSKKGKTIPVGLCIGRVPIIGESAAIRTAKEAEALAYFEINRSVLSALPDAQILSKTYEGGENPEGDAYRLICRVECITDIAKIVPFYITQNEDLQNGTENS